MLSVLEMVMLSATVAILVLVAKDFIQMRAARKIFGYLHLTVVLTISFGVIWENFESESAILSWVGYFNPVFQMMVSWTIHGMTMDLRFILMQGVMWLDYLCLCLFFGNSKVFGVFLGAATCCATVGTFLVMASKINARLKQRAADALLTKETFLNRMSHELRTPLAAIVGLTETCDDSIDVRTSLSSICDAAVAGLHIVDEVLDWRLIIRCLYFKQVVRSFSFSQQLSETKGADARHFHVESPEGSNKNHFQSSAGNQVPATHVENHKRGQKACCYRF